MMNYNDFFDDEIPEKSKVMILLEKQEFESIIRRIFREETKKLESNLSKKDRILTRKEAAALVGIDVNTISKRVKEGVLTNLGQGRKVLISEKELLEKKPKTLLKYRERI